MSLRNDTMRCSVLGFRSDIRIELQAPVMNPGTCSTLLPNLYSFDPQHSSCIIIRSTRVVNRSGSTVFTAGLTGFSRTRVKVVGMQLQLNLCKTVTQK